MFMRPLPKQPHNEKENTLSELRTEENASLSPVELYRTERDDVREAAKRGSGSSVGVCKDGKREARAVSVRGFAGNQGTYFRSFSPIPTERYATHAAMVER